jgi:hypothetical protein
MNVKIEFTDDEISAAQLALNAADMAGAIHAFASYLRHELKKAEILAEANTLERIHGEYWSCFGEYLK